MCSRGCSRQQAEGSEEEDQGSGLRRRQGDGTEGEKRKETPFARRQVIQSLCRNGFGGRQPGQPEAWSEPAQIAPRQLIGPNDRGSSHAQPSLCGGVAEKAVGSTRFHNERAAATDAQLLGRRLYETMLVWDTEKFSDPVMAEFTEIWRPLEKIVFSG